MSIILYSTAAVFAIWAIDIVAHDMRTCKIKNSKLIVGLKILAGFLLLHIVLTAAAEIGVYSGISLKPAFYTAYIIHIAFIIVFGVLLWIGEIWPAGDAKFFIVVGAMLPLIRPDLHGFPMRAFFYFLINIFVAAAFWASGTFLLSGLQNFNRKAFFNSFYTNLLSEIRRLREKYKSWQLLFVLSGLLVLFLLQRTISLTVRLTVARIVYDPAVLFFALFLLWDKLAPVFRKKAWIVFTAIFYALFVILGYIFFPDKLFELVETAFVDCLKFSVFIVTVRRLVVFLVEQADLRFFYPEQLQLGMILSENSRALVRNDPNFNQDFDSFVKDGLTEVQIKILRDNAQRLREKIPNLRYEIIKGRPFAGWIFLGAIISLLFRDNIAHLLFR